MNEWLRRNLSFFISCMILFCGTIAYSQVSGPQAVAGEYIVKMKTNNASGVSGKSSLAIVASMAKSGAVVKRSFRGSSLLQVQAASLAALQANPDVEFAEPNYILSVDPVDIQPMGVAPGVFDDYSQSFAGVQVTDSWTIAKPYNQGTKTVVAVIDTGLDRSHKLFSDSNGIWINSAELAGTPGVDDDGNGYIDDVNGWNFVSRNANIDDDDDHGTHVAGIILGVGQDVLAFPVRESKVKIMAIKFLDANGSGTTADAISAMYYAVNNGAKVINNSWGGGSYSRALHEAYTYAYNHEVVIASAAGNSGTNNDSTPMYPANLDTPNNISVAATTDSDTKASFSNYGSVVTVAAPGVAIISSIPGTGCIDPGCFQLMTGTSMASPFVAGLAAMVIREAPQLSAYQIKSIIMGSVDAFPALSGKVSTSGRVNALKTVQSAIAQAATAAWAPSYAPVYKADRSVASESSDSGGGGGCGLVKTILDNGSNLSGPSSGGALSDAFVALLIALIPLAYAVHLRSKTSETQTSPANRRQFARYNLAKSLVVKIGDQVVHAASETLSVGGLSFVGNMQLGKGEKIKVKIADLDHEVEGEIVWCSQKQSYGVKFLNVTDQLRAQMSMWTMGLNPT